MSDAYVIATCAVLAVAAEGEHALPVFRCGERHPAPLWRNAGCRTDPPRKGLRQRNVSSAQSDIVLEGDESAGLTPLPKDVLPGRFEDLGNR